MKPERIRVIAICVFRRGDEILVAEEFDDVEEKPFYRPVGGGVEPGELAIAAAEREVLEELNQPVKDLALLGVLESVFVSKGRPGHEIVYVFDGRFVNEELEQQAVVMGMEADGTPIRAVWRSLNSFDSYHRLVPEGLLPLLKKRLESWFSVRLVHEKSTLQTNSNK